MQSAKLDLCRLLVEDHEHRRGRAYDWIVKARPDGLFAPPPPSWHIRLRRDTVYFSRNSGDCLVLVPRAALGALACGWRARPPCKGSWRSFAVNGQLVGTPVLFDGLVNSGFGANDVELVSCAIVRPRGDPAKMKSLWQPDAGKGISPDQVSSRLEAHWASPTMRHHMNLSIIYHA